MTTYEIKHLTAEEFKNLSVEDRLEAIEVEHSSYEFHRDLMVKYKYTDHRGWEYRQHKKFAKESWDRLSMWLNGMGIETNPMPEV